MDKRKKNPVTAPMPKKRPTEAAAFERERAVALCMVAINGTAVSSPPRAGGILSEALDRTPLPTLRIPGEWHLPYVYPNELVVADAEDFRQATEHERAKLSTARCARVSYLTHDGLRDVNADLALHDKLLASGHMSPFEHAAKVLPGRAHMPFYGNFRSPWIQYRKMLPGESVFRGR